MTMRALPTRRQFGAVAAAAMAWPGLTRTGLPAKTAFDFGAKGDGIADDGPALQALLDAGGGTIPPGRFLCRQAPLTYRSGLRLVCHGTIVIGTGWPSAYALCSAAMLRGAGRTQDVELVFIGDGRVELGETTSPAPRKGIGITRTDGFNLVRPRVVGGPGNNLFALEIRESTRGTINGGFLAIDTKQTSQGADGIHFVGPCSDVTIANLRTASADDSSSQTHEVLIYADTVIRRLRYSGCHLFNIGHSGLKALIGSRLGSAVIEDVEYSNCTFETSASASGAGVPILMQNFARASGGAIRNVAIRGGRTILRDVKPGIVGDAAIRVENVDGLSITGHEIEHPKITAIIARDCADLEIADVRVHATRPGLVPHADRAVLELIRCSNARVAVQGGLVMPDQMSVRRSG